MLIASVRPQWFMFGTTVVALLLAGLSIILSTQCQSVTVDYRNLPTVVPTQSIADPFCIYEIQP